MDNFPIVIVATTSVSAALADWRDQTRLLIAVASLLALVIAVMLFGSSSIVQAVVNIAAARHMTTTAEGVETEQQKASLHALGCTEMQGFLFSPAIPAAAIRQLLHSQARKIGAVA